MDFRRRLHDLLFARFWQALILGLGIAISAGLALLMQRYETAVGQQQFEREADRIKEAIQDRFEIYLHQLEAVRASLISDTELGRDRFREVVASLDLRQHAGVMGIGFVRRVPKDGLERYVEQIRQSGQQDFGLRSLGTPLPHEYRLLELSVSIDTGLPPPFGLDYGSEPVRRSATETAMLRGEAALTGAVALQRGGHGHIYVLPVYRPGLPAETELQRREALTGWAIMAIATQEMMRNIAGKDAAPFDIELYEDTPSGLRALFDSDGLYDDLRHSNEGKQFRATRNLRVGGHDWVMALSSLPAYERQTGSFLPYAVLAASLTFSSLLALLVGLLRREGWESEQSLRENREYLSQVLRSSVDGTIVIDERGTIEQFNAAAEKLFGYRASEVIGRNVSLLMPSPHREQHNDYLARYLAGAPPKVVGIGREVSGLAKDGRRLELWLGVNRFTMGGKTRFVGSLVDISAHKRMQEELRQHRDHLQALVDERTAELRTAKEAAEKANAMKTAFFARMSHELRTPLHAINSFAELGLEKSGSVPAEKLQHYFSKIHAAGERMLGMVDELLDLSRLEAGKMHFHFHRHDVVPALREVAAELQSLAEKKPVSITIAPANVSTTLTCDINRLQQVFRNLLANAIRFSPEGGNISIGFEATKLPGRRAGDPDLAALQMAIADQGLGIPPDELESIFGEFEQSRNAESGQGTGLGLAICRQIVHAHQGRIWAENNASGGATILLALPYHPAS